jgi:hypothetical protein
VSSFDRVNHDTLMSLVKKRVADRRMLQLIDRYLKAGALTDDAHARGVAGPRRGRSAAVKKRAAITASAERRAMALSVIIALYICLDSCDLPYQDPHATLGRGRVP